MLNLGLFMMPLHPANKDVGVSYEEDRKLVLLADKLNCLFLRNTRSTKKLSLERCVYFVES